MTLKHCLADGLQKHSNELNATAFHIADRPLPPFYGLEYWEFLFTLRSGIGWIGPGFACLSGFTLVVILAVLAVFSLPCVRQSGYFEVSPQYYASTYFEFWENKHVG